MAMSAAHSAGLIVVKITPIEVPTLESGLTAKGYLRILPSMWTDSGGLDGFFIARFTKPFS